MEERHEMCEFGGQGTELPYYTHLSRCNNDLFIMIINNDVFNYKTNGFCISLFPIPHIYFLFFQLLFSLSSFLFFSHITLSSVARFSLLFLVARLRFF